MAPRSGRDAIPSLTDPNLVAADHPWADYLLPTDRVIGIKVGSEYLAFPHNVLWWHEIVNMSDLGLAITYCPLTGSSMVFSNAAAGGAGFGVSGLLFDDRVSTGWVGHGHSGLAPEESRLLLNPLSTPLTHIVGAPSPVTDRSRSRTQPVRLAHPFNTQERSVYSRASGVAHGPLHEVLHERHLEVVVT